MGITKAVVSGSSGFLGRKLALRLLQLNVPVFGVDLGFPPFTMSGYQHAQSDIGQAGDAIMGFLKGGGVFFHMAGLADRRQCEERPADAFAANVALTFTALKICERAGNVKFILPSTGIVYGFHLDRLAVEDDSTHPESAYAGTKLVAENLVRAHTPGRLNGSVVARLSNVYGPGIGENTVMGRLMGQAARREALHVLDERPVRDFIHVDDVVEALVRLANIDAPESLVVNVSTARGVRIGDAVGMVARISGSPIPISGSVPDEPVTQLILSNALLDELTDWVPQIQLEDGLKICLKGSGTFNPNIKQRL